VDVWTVLARCRRRWWAALAGFALVLGGGLLFASQPPRYAVTASLLVTTQSPRPGSGVPVSAALLATTQALASTLVSDGAGGRLGVERGGVLYQVVPEEFGANLQHGGPTYGPILDVTTIAPTPQRATEALMTVTDRARAWLASGQAALELHQHVARAVIRVVARSASATALVGRKKRAAVVLLLLATAVGMAAASVADVLPSRLRPIREVPVG
jgi:hypothetical protein